MPNRLNAQVSETLCEEFESGRILEIGAPNITVDASSLDDTYFPPGTKIYIQGTLNIDESTHFDACMVRMGTAAQIVVSAQVSLTIDYSTFFSCDEMWTGIKIYSASSVTVTNSHFEDAFSCFQVIGTSNYTFSGNTFDRNQVGIQVAVLFDPIRFEGNAFTCSSTLKAPLAGKFSTCGMTITASAYLGSQFQAHNTFSNMQCGIYALKCLVVLYRASFSDMFEDSVVFSGLPGGSGIIAIGCDLRVNEFLFAFNETTACKFENNEHAGITTRGGKQTIRNSRFRSNLNGIDSRSNNTGMSFLVQYSEFLDLGFPTAVSESHGIFHERSNANSTSGPSSISNNRFVTSNSDYSIFTYAIRVKGTAPSTNLFVINNNNFENFSPRNLRFISVMPNQSDNFIIDYNRMVFHESITTASRYGVELLTGTGVGHKAGNNSVIGDNGVMDGHTFTCGFHVDKSPNFNMCVDSTDWGLRGFHFPTNSNRIEFRENIIGHHDLGIQIGKNGEIGPQIRTLNRWSTDAGAYGVWAAEHQNATTYLQSAFVVHSDDPKFLPTPRSPTDDWFVLQIDDPNGCAELFTGIQLDSFDRKVAAGDQSAYSAAETWDAERRVYLKLLRFPDLSEDPAISNFFEQIDSTSSGQYAKVNFALWQALLMPEAIQEDLDDLQQQIFTHTDSIAVLDSLLEISFNSTIFSSKGQRIHEMDSLWAAVDLTVEQVTDDRSAVLDSILLMVQNLPQTTAYEQARADYLKLTIFKGQGLDFDLTELELIRTLAQGSDSLIGVTRLEARILLTPHDTLWGELIDPSCAEEAERRNDFVQNANGEVFSISIQPNPADNLVVLQFAKSLSGQAILFDAYGRLALERRFRNNMTLSFETTQLTAGIYVCHVRLGNGAVRQYKLVISH